jgi:hypothetical protein
MKNLAWALAVVTCIGCKSKDKPSASPTGVGSGGGGETAAAPKLEPVGPVGMTDPFARMTSETAKELNKGYKAQRAKKFDDAVASFRTVVAALPDYTAARWALVRSLVGAAKFDDAVKELEPLLARDYVGYANALDSKKEFAPLRAAPAWAKVGELKTAYRAAYAKGLDGGFFFVARTRPAAEPKLDEGGTGPLDLKQEIFHFDPDGKRFRRLSETGGHVFALARSPDGKTLTFLIAPKLFRTAGVDYFADPQLALYDLATLEVSGPATLKGHYNVVTLGFDASGAPAFSTLDQGVKTEWHRFDTAKTGLATVSEVELAGGLTEVSAVRVTHVANRTTAGVKVSDGANQFTIEGVPTPVVAARPIESASLDWSPGKTRLTYAGKIDACKILKGEGKDKNELYVFDMGKKTAQRVAAAISAFETLWLDDDRLVYEGGVGKDGTLHLYAFASHADSALPTRYGAGLYGVPTLSCEPEDVSNEPASEESEGD